MLSPLTGLKSLREPAEITRDMASGAAFETAQGGFGTAQRGIWDGSTQEEIGGAEEGWGYGVDVDEVDCDRADPAAQGFDGRRTVRRADGTSVLVATPRPYPPGVSAQGRAKKFGAIQ